MDIFRISLLSFLIFMVFLTGSVLMAQEPEVVAEEIPAVISAYSEETHKEIELTISKALGRGPVLLGPDVFLRNDVIIVERKQRRSIDGGMLQGRSMERPEKFRLVIKESRCVLVHLKSKNYYPLTNLSCERKK